MMNWNGCRPIGLIHGLISPAKRFASRVMAAEMTAATPKERVHTALVDNFGRAHTYLRISLTEKCNLRCTYCMPEEGVPLTPSERLLRTHEIVRLARVFAANGVEKIRLTGGEPTVRRDLVEIVGQLSRLPGIRAVGMTSNGIVLTRKLDALVEAGLTHLNLSLDTLNPTRYAILTRRNGFEKVMRVIDCAERALPTQLKLNCVVIRGINEDEVADFVAMTEKRDVDVRFIEYMPFGGNAFDVRKLVPYREMLAAIGRRFPDVVRLRDAANSTSKAYQVDGFRGRFGFITSMSEHFCAGCNRLRVTADGNLKVCLHGAAEVSLRDRLRDGATDAQLLDAIGAALRKKHAQHAAADVQFLALSSPKTPAPTLFHQSTSRLPWIVSRRDLHVDAHEPAARRLSHVDERGTAHMVDVTRKAATERVATAAAVVEYPSDIFEQIFATPAARATTPKGDIFGVARVAGVQAAKRTADFIPLCHQIALSHVDVRFRVDTANHRVEVFSRVKCTHGTGVEMEALTACALAALTLYDMCKALSAAIRVADLRVTGKRGGKSAPLGDEIWPPAGSQ